MTHKISCLALLPLLLACTANRKWADPTVFVHGAGGTELGVSTEYGVVFLGSTRPAGSIEIESWFGDGPNIEPSVVEPVGGDLFTAETEIRLATVPMTFAEPVAGEVLVLRGRGTEGVWEQECRVHEVPGVTGILVDLVPELRRADQDQTGAGLFRRAADGRLFLLGLVSGVAEFEGKGPLATVVGPTDLWRVVMHRKDQGRRRPWVYREDTL